jgi:glycine oxidase
MSAHVAVVGGGVIGLAIAWETLRRGHRVTLIDPAPAQGATHAAAGMLAAVSELHYQEENLLTLTRASAGLYPEFIAALEDRTGKRTGYLATETLVVGLDAADRRALADLKEAQLAQGLQVEELTVRQARRQEPLLGPQLSGVFRIPDDHQVDPRRLAAALLAALQHSPQADVVPASAAGLRSDGSGTVTGVRLAGGGAIEADEVVLANGLGAAGLDGLPDGLKLPLRPVYGDILRLAVPEHLRPLVTATVRGLVRGFPAYLVPRQDGTVVIGATQREDGSAAVSAGGVYELLRDAQQLVPAVAELELLEATCRARPGTPDNAPLLGRAAAAGLIIATGFFRHGVLLAPIAARICADLVDGKPADPAHRQFRPDRFSHPLNPVTATSGATS